MKVTGRVTGHGKGKNPPGVVHPPPELVKEVRGHVEKNPSGMETAVHTYTYHCNWYTFYADAGASSTDVEVIGHVDENPPSGMETVFKCISHLNWYISCRSRHDQR